jgi:hypothetical protein
MKRVQIETMVAAVVGGIFSALGGTTYYSGNGTANGTLAQAVKWYTDASYTTAADPQPTPTANDDNTSAPEGLVTYTATWVKTGFSIIVR